VVTVRVILFPVFVKQIKSQRAMQALQPKVKALQEKHKGDRETLQKEMMELYKTEKANPLMGCLPMFLQIPVFLGLFHTPAPAEPVERTRPRCTVGRPSSSNEPPARGRCSLPAGRRSSAPRRQDSPRSARTGTTVKIVGRHPGPDHDDHHRTRPAAR
jgi:YidC/Oxa1 family membrane protein insertase